MIKGSFKLNCRQWLDAQRMVRSYARRKGVSPYCRCQPSRGHGLAIYRREDKINEILDHVASPTDNRSTFSCKAAWALSSLVTGRTYTRSGRSALTVIRRPGLSSLGAPHLAARCFEPSQHCPYRLFHGRVPPIA